MNDPCAEIKQKYHRGYMRRLHFYRERDKLFREEIELLVSEVGVDEWKGTNTDLAERAKNYERLFKKEKEKRGIDNEDNEEYIEQLKDKMAQAERIIADLRKRNGKYFATIAEQEAENSRLREKLKSRHEKVRELGDLLAQARGGCQEEKSKLRKKIEELEEKLKESMATISGQSDVMSKLQQRFPKPDREALMKALADKTRENLDLQNEIDRLNSLLEEKSKMLGEAQVSAWTDENLRESILSDNTKMREDLSNLQRENRVQRETIARQSNLASKLQRENQDLKDQIDRMADIEKIEEVQGILRETIDKLFPLKEEP